MPPIFPSPWILEISPLLMTSMTSFNPLRLFFYLSGTFSRRKHELHGREPTDRDVKRASIKKKSQSDSVIEWIPSRFVVFVCWKLFNTPCYVVKSTDEDNSKHARSITRFFRRIIRPLQFSAFWHSSIGDFPLAV